MKIRKKFTIGGVSHIVRNCTSDRCKHSLHGHTYDIEILMTSNKLDNGHMVYDFGLFKDSIKTLIKSFEKTYILWTREPKEFKENIKNMFERWVEVKHSPSAERIAEMLFGEIRKILNKTTFANGEVGVDIDSIKVHETRTGYAEYSMDDFLEMGDDDDMSRNIKHTNVNSLIRILDAKEFVYEKMVPQVIE